MVKSNSSSADKHAPGPARQLILLRLSEAEERERSPRLHCWSERGWQPVALDGDFMRAFNPDCEVADHPEEVDGLENDGAIQLSFPEGTRALLLLPGNWVWSGLEALPKAARRQSRSIGYMVEECLAEDVEDLHFVCQPRNGNLCSIYAVAAKKMEALHHQLQRLGWPLLAAIPEYQLLDLLQDDVALWLDGDQAHIWYGEGYGLSVRRRYLQPLLASLVESGGDREESEEEVPGVQLLGAGEDDAMTVAELESLFGDRLRRTDGVVEETLLAHCKPARLPNLMSGEYQLADGTEEQDWWRRPLKVAAACFIAQLLLFAGAGGYFQWRADGAEAQARALFSELFPQDTPRADVRRQIEGYLKQAGSSGGNFADQIQLLSRAWGQHRGGALKLRSLRFDGNRGEIVLQLQAPNLTDLDTFVGRLSEGGYGAQLLAANELEKGVSGRIRLR